MEASKQLHGISRKMQETPKWLKSIWWDTNEQTSHQANTREKLSSQDHPVKSAIPVSNKCYPTRGSLIPIKLIQAKIGVLSVGIPDMLKDSSVQPRSTSIHPVTSMDISQPCVSRNKYFSNQKHPSTPTTSWRNVLGRWLYMQPVRRIYF